MENLAQRIDTRTLATLLLPSFLFALAVVILVAARHDWRTAVDGIAALDEVEGSLLAVLALSAWLLVVGALAIATRALVRLFEGYWGHSALAQALCRQGQAREADRLERLRRRATPEAYAARYYTLPSPGAALLPTRFGNAMRAAESYPGDDERYGMDAVFFWPRLYFVVPDAVRSAVGQARGTIERCVIACTLSALLTLIALALAVNGHTPRALCLAMAAGAAFVTWLSYEGAVGAAMTFGELLRAAFDLYRRDLLVKLGLRPPATLEEERALWKALGQQLYRRGADQPELIRYEVPAAAPVTAANDGADAQESGEP